MEKSKLREAAWDQTFSKAVEQACKRAILELFPDVREAASRQALAQGFLTGVDWCFSEQSDNDIAKATLAMGLGPDKAVHGAIRKML